MAPSAMTADVETGPPCNQMLLMKLKYLAWWLAWDAVASGRTKVRTEKAVYGYAQGCA